MDLVKQKHMREKGKKKAAAHPMHGTEGKEMQFFFNYIHNFVFKLKCLTKVSVTCSIVSIFCY